MEVICSWESTPTSSSCSSGGGVLLHVKDVVVVSECARVVHTHTHSPSLTHRYTQIHISTHKYSSCFGTKIPVAEFSYARYDPEINVNAFINL